MKLNFITKPLFIIVFTILTSTIFAQNSSNDEIVLRNGSIIKGTITENSAEKIIIKTSDGREYIFSKSEVEKTTLNGTTTVNTNVENNNQPLNTTKTSNDRKKYIPVKRGFWLSTEIQLLSPPSINIVAGYKFHQFGYLGLGTGIHNYTELQFSNNYRPFTGTIIPIYVRYSGDILNRRVTPVYSLELGYGIAVSNGAFFENYNNYYYNTGFVSTQLSTKGGIYGALGFGFKVRTNKNLSFGAGFTYRVQQATFSELVDSGNGIYDTNLKATYILQRFGLKLIFIGFN